MKKYKIDSKSNINRDDQNVNKNALKILYRPNLYSIY